MIVLSPLEIKILEQLEDRLEHNQMVIAQAVDLQPYTVRAMLKQLKHRFLVTRTLSYQWRITAAGVAAIEEQRQLRLVGGDTAHG